jgi:ribosomal protein S12 methylthiotransferase accessory factor
MQIFTSAHSVPKAYLQGTHRTRTPRETIAAYRGLMPRMGITRLANVTGLDCIGIPVYTAIRPNSRSLATSQGKGLDADAAKASALMESIEMWHAEWIESPLRWDSRQSVLGSAAAIDLSQLPHFQLPREDTPRLWIEGFDIVTSKACWAPFEAVTFNLVPVPGFRSPFFQSTNGLASGNHLLEAIVHGFCEVIERDAEALWRLDDEVRQLDLGSVSDPYCRGVLSALERAGVFTVAWDITSDVGVPVYACAILERPDDARLRSLGVHYGFGCHLAPEVALSRALTEAVQTRLTYISGSRDDFLRHHYDQMNDQKLIRQIWEESCAFPSTHRLDEQPSRAGATFEEDIEHLVSRVQAVGISEVVVVDLTKEEIAIPVVRVLVPGLEGPGDHLPGRRARAMAKES